MKGTISLQKGAVEDDSAEVDPLEAFMSELDATDAYVPQESLNDLRSSGASHHHQQTVGNGNTITLDELMSMTVSSHGGEGWESDANSHAADDTDDESASEETLNKDRQDFMKAIRTMHGTVNKADVKDLESPNNISGDSTPPPDGVSVEPTSLGNDINGTLKQSAADASVDEDAAKDSKKTEKQLGRMWASEGDVMEEHEREVR